ncbi:MAG: polysaccharide biosynthesis tyrosine autokinase [Kiritimatiellae bacterium]|nr:polysaccharide biosynthesis tyrosine autokinase [Kiritimatiellia bacterium]
MSEQDENLHLLDYWRVIRSRKEIVIAVALVVVIVGVIITCSRPKVYMASTLIRVKDKEESGDLTIWRAPRMSYNPQYLATQFEVIQSRPILEDVVLRLDLHHRLGEAYGYLGVQGEERSFERTVKILSSRMKVQQYRNTDLIEIRLTLWQMGGEKEMAPEEVARIVNMIPRVYRDESEARSRRVKESALKALGESLDDQNERVLAADQKVENIRSKYKLDMIYAYGSRGSSLAKESLRHLDALRIRAGLELADKDARLKTIMKLPENELVDAAPRVVGDDMLLNLVASKRKAEVELSRLQDVYGRKHPNVTSLSAAIKELDQKIADAIKGVKTAVQADYDSAKAKMDTLIDEFEKQKLIERKAEGEGYREFETAREELGRARTLRDALESRYLQEKIKLRIPKTSVEVISPAKVPAIDEFVSPNLQIDILLSILVGLAAGLGLAYFVEYLDTSVKTIEDVEKHMGVQVLGVIPQRVKPLVEKGADPAHMEAYRVLRANIQFSKNLQGGKALCFTSGSVGEGKSLTLFNLAYICAQLGSRTIIVDTDLHRPRQHKLLGVSNDTGVADVMVGELAPADAVRPTGIANLDVLTSGQQFEGVHGLFDAVKIRELATELKENYDHVFFDAPPLIGVSDASMLVRELDGVILVIQHRKYPRIVSDRAKSMLENLGGNLIGVVLNNINISRDYSSYYFQGNQYYRSAKRRIQKSKSV